MSGNTFVFFWGFSITLLAVAASVSSFEPLFSLSELSVTTVEAGKTMNSMYLSTAQNTLITASK
jgi:hypothetical protein